MDSPIPRYEQVRVGLLHMLDTHYQPGDILPTREELAAKFETSLITVKRALDELGRAQRVRSIRGKGTVVMRPEVTDRRAHVSSWTDSVTGLGERPQTGWLHIEEVVPDSIVRERLELLARAKVIHLTRLRLVQSRPICLMTNTLPAALVPGLAQRGLHHESLYQDLQEYYRLYPARAEETVSVHFPTKEERHQLDSNAKALLRIERLTRLDDGSPMELAEVLAPSDRYRYQVDLINSPRKQ